MNINHDSKGRFTTSKTRMVLGTLFFASLFALIIYGAANQPNTDAYEAPKVDSSTLSDRFDSFYTVELAKYRSRDDFKAEVQRAKDEAKTSYEAELRKIDETYQKISELRVQNAMLTKLEQK